MFIFILKKTKNGIMQILRLLFALSILIILIAQLWGVIKSINFPDRIKDEQHPSGNPMKVEQAVPAVLPEESDENIFNRLFNRLIENLKDYHRGK